MSEEIFQLGLKAVFRNTDEQILLHQEYKPYWDLLGGRIHKEETVEEGLRREIFEETGIKDFSIEEKLWTGISNIRVDRQKEEKGLVLFVYSCNLREDVPLKDDELRWFDTQEAVAMLTEKYPKEFLDVLLGM